MVLKVLSDWFEVRAKFIQTDELALFISDRRKRIDARTVQVFIKKYAQKSGLNKKLSPHVLRHSHCTLLQMKGVPIRTAMELLGHRQLSTTARYSHSNEAAMRRAVNTFAKGSYER